MKGVFCFRVKNKEGKEGIWIVDAKNGSGAVSYGGPGQISAPKISNSKSVRDYKNS